MTLMIHLLLKIPMTEDVLQNINEIREAHKAMHWSKKVYKQTLIERLEDWRTVEDTINTGNGKWDKYVFYKIPKKWKKTTKK